MTGKSLAIAWGLLAASAPSANAQSSDTDGALVLLLPVGAQSVGMGQAMVAERPGSEGVWWNPSGIARLTKREAAIHHSETLAARGDAITVVLPSKSLGTIALSLNVLDFGNQQITDGTGQPVGLVLPRNVLVAATYGAAVGKRFSLGLTYKRLQYRVDCTGQCANVSTFSAATDAVDVGAQYEFPDAIPLRLGAAVRNIGGRLQLTDGDEADPLPTRVELGASYQLKFIEKYVSDVNFRLAGDVIATESADDPSARVGAVLTYQNTAHLRAG
ncbi:MAG: PorV/PorQ family protein, partial [Gemmatimonadaceae bacterium]